MWKNNKYKMYTYYTNYKLLRLFGKCGNLVEK